MSEKYEVEELAPGGDKKWNHSDLDDAMIQFYTLVGLNYREPSVEVAIHDLVRGKTLASFTYSMNDNYGKVIYDL